MVEGNLVRELVWSEPISSDGVICSSESTTGDVGDEDDREGMSPWIAVRCRIGVELPRETNFEGCLFPRFANGSLFTGFAIVDVTTG